MPSAFDRTRKAWQNFVTEILVGKRRLTPSKWKAQFDRLRRDIKAYHEVLASLGSAPAAGEADPRELLIWAWCVLISTPSDTRQLYAMLKEHTDDRKGIEDLANTIRAKGYEMKGLPTSPEMQMCWLGGLLRAIDADLAGIDYWPPHGTKWRAADWQVPGYPCFIVPVRRDYRCEDGKEPRRRGTRYHALVPSVLGGVPVELALHPEVSTDRDARDWLYGAAIFDKLTVTIDRIGDDRFKLLAAPLENEGDVIAGQVEAALASGCDTLVWPELTVPEARRELIRSSLSRNSLADSRRVPLVLAGSWHEPSKAGLVNRSHIFASRGTPLVRYDKRRIYEFDGRFEAITPGGMLPVVVMEDRLVGFAICKDFCDDCDDDIYHELGIDLVLIASMGTQTTLDAHGRSAKQLQSQQGAISFLVQQIPVETGSAPADGAPIGYSFAVPLALEPKGVSRPDPAQNTEFRTLYARR